MSEVNRTSAGEQARADQIKASQKQVKTRQTQNATQQGATKHQPQGTEKKLKSAFDNVLDTVADSQEIPLTPAESKFDGRLQEIQQEDDRSSHDDGDDEQDDKVKHKTDKNESAKTSSTGVKGRVASKHGTKGQSQGSQSGEQQEGQSQGKMSDKQIAADLYKQTQLKGQPAPAPSPVFAGMPVSQVAAPEAVASPRELPKAVLDQIVQSVTIARKKEMDKEIQIDFHDNFFNGLKLKVTARGKEISIEFIAPNRDVEATFKNEREKIAAVLGEKDIDVRSIEVTMR